MEYPVNMYTHIARYLDILERARAINGNKTVLTSGNRPIRPKANADPATGLQKCVDGVSVTSNSPYAIRMATNRAAKHEPQSNYGRISITTSVDQVASDDGLYPATAVNQGFFFDP